MIGYRVFVQRPEGLTAPVYHGGAVVDIGSTIFAECRARFRSKCVEPGAGKGCRCGLYFVRTPELAEEWFGSHKEFRLLEGVPVVAEVETIGTVSKVFPYSAEYRAAGLKVLRLLESERLARGD